MAERSGALPWRLERYRDGDEHAILQLFTTVFGRARSLEHWTWQFKSNPYGGPFCSMARRESDGAVVGSYSVMPVMLNVLGRPVLGCQSVDTAVHPDHRGQRIFEQTASDCYAWCMSQGVKAVIGFPNASSYPGFVRALGWRRIAYPVRHSLRLSIEPALRRILGVPLLPGLADLGYGAVRSVSLNWRRAMARRFAGGGLVFRVADAVPQGYDGLWNAWRGQEVLSVWKDAAYMSWRYDRNPDHRFRYFYLERDGAIQALAVSVDLDGALTLCELLVANHDVPLGQRLVAEIALHALAAGHKAVSFLGADAGFQADAFAGFDHQNSYSNVFGGRSFEEGPLGAMLPFPGSWVVSFGDGDFV